MTTRPAAPPPPPELTIEQVDRLMLAIEKIDRLIAMFDPPPLPKAKPPRVVTRYVDHRPKPEPDLAILVGSIERRLTLLDVRAAQDGSAGLVALVKTAIERLEYLASYTRGFLSKDGLTGSEGTANNIDLIARDLRDGAALWLVGDLQPETKQGERR